MKKTIQFIKFVSVILLIALLLVCPLQQSRAGTFDAGAGFNYIVDSSEAEYFAAGLDLQGGYTWLALDTCNLGPEMHLILGLTGKKFYSSALYLTARPQASGYEWIQLRGGIVYADYETPATEWKGPGMALGAGILFGGDNVQIHFLDYNYYRLGGKSFSVWSISFAIAFI